MSSNVTQPSHYQGAGMECREAIRGMLGRPGFIAYCRGNAMKYLWRSLDKRNTVEDLAKAKVYLSWIQDEIETNQISLF